MSTVAFQSEHSAQFCAVNCTNISPVHGAGQNKHQLRRVCPCNPPKGFSVRSNKLCKAVWCPDTCSSQLPVQHLWPVLYTALPCHGDWRCSRRIRLTALVWLDACKALQHAREVFECCGDSALLLCWQRKDSQKKSTLCYTSYTPDKCSGAQLIPHITGWPHPGCCVDVQGCHRYFILHNLLLGTQCSMRGHPPHKINAACGG